MWCNTTISLYFGAGSGLKHLDLHISIQIQLMISLYFGAGSGLKPRNGGRGQDPYASPCTSVQGAD